MDRSQARQARRQARLDAVRKEHKTADSESGGEAANYRFVVVREAWVQERRHITMCAERWQVDQIAVAELKQGWMPLCYYDLDEEPAPAEGDRVWVDGDKDVAAGEYKVTDVRENGLLILEAAYELEGEATATTIDKVIVLSRDSPHPTLPRRYDLAAVLVVFNSAPSSPTTS